MGGWVGGGGKARGKNQRAEIESEAWSSLDLNFCH